MVHAHLFDGYWEDLGTVKSYHEANLALAGDDPPFDFHSPEGVIYTRMRYLPASRVAGADAEALPDQRRLRHPGGRRPGALRRSACAAGSAANVTLRDTVDHRRRPLRDRRRAGRQPAGDRPDLGVGEGAVIERAILDKDCRIGRNVRIVNRRGVRDDEGDNYVIRDGIVVIPRDWSSPTAR